jgi:hypothetical protein
MMQGVPGETVLVVAAALWGSVLWQVEPGQSWQGLPCTFKYS